MKTHLIMTLILFLIMIFFPLITLTYDRTEKNGTETTAESTAVEENSSDKAPATETVTLMVSATGKLTEMSAEEYVYGAVCAEMPASFHPEALKAQAVASYTYMKWLKENSDNPKRIGADITDNSAIHQAYVTENELREKWGSSYDIYSEKVKKAVSSVLYEFLTFENETAMTVFHGLSPGRTVSAADVWGTDIPYLQSVTASGDKLSPEASTEITLSAEEFLKPFNSTDEKDVKSILKSAKKNENGYISRLSLKNKKLTSTDLRSAYGLKSPYFTAKLNEDNITLTVHGKGHGVGMSQYSADYMARQGSTYKEILYHFYKGTKLKKN